MPSQFKPFDKVLVRNADEPWYTEIYSHYSPKSKFPYTCAYGAFQQCILFEDNRKLFSSNTKDFYPFQPVLVRDSSTDSWSGDLFAKYDKGRFDCIFSNWKECIPYTGNESLLKSEEGFSPFEEILIKYEDDPGFPWNIDFFLGINNSNPRYHRFRTISGYYTICIRYENNENLIG